MASSPLWTLPVPSTAILDGGEHLEDRPGREIAIRFRHEKDDDSVQDTRLVFEGVEAFRVTYLWALETAMLDAYDQLVDCGNTSWLQSVRAAISQRGGPKDHVRHLMITFDDGPCYEFICRTFRIEAQ